MLRTLEFQTFLTFPSLYWDVILVADRGVGGRLLKKSKAKQLTDLISPQIEMLNLVSSR